MSQFPEQNKIKKKVLIADDEENIISIIKVGLEIEGYEVYTAQDGEKAIELFNSVIPDIVILDIILPIMDGWNVLSYIKASKNNCPVIMLSAKDTFEDVGKSLNVGADAHLFKPFDIDRIIKKVKQFVK